MQAKILNVIGTLLFALNQWIQVILIARLLGIYEVGLFSYFLALTGPFVLFSRFMMSVLLPTQRKLNYDYDAFLSFRNLSNFTFVIAMISIMIAVDLSIYESACMILFIIFKFYENKEDFIYAENVAENKIDFLAYSKIYKSVITLLLFAITIYVFESLFAALSGLLIAQLLIYYLYDRRHSFSYLNRKFDINFRELKNIFLLGIGLTIVEVLNSLIMNIPRYVLEYFHSLEVLGIFSTIMYFLIITNNIVVAMIQGVLASFVHKAEQSFKKFYRSFFEFCGLMLLLVIAGEIILVVSGSELLVIVYGDSFAGYEMEMMLLGGILFLHVYMKLFEMALSVFNLYNIQVVLQGVTFFCAIALSYFLIVPYGLTGAFLTTILSYIILLMGQLAVLVHHWKYGLRS